jgi:hypothetical protein
MLFPLYSCMPALSMTALYPVICRSYIFLYSGPSYSYMSVLHTRICRSYILLYVGLTYSYMSVLHTLIFRSYILLNVSPLYSNMSMLYTVICQLPTLPYSDIYTVICRCFQCDMVVYRRGRHCHTWVHTTDSLWMDNQNTFLFLLLDTFYFKTINIWLWLGVMVFNVTFNNISVISWQSVLLVDAIGDYQFIK